ncbi:MAG: TetR/AcrR family transcriptional regulator [Methylococcales bacterium]
MARRSEHSQQEIKEMVLKAAETIVVEEGFDKLKVRKVAMEIGYTVGSIYMVFENMADLIMHIKGKTLDDIATQLNAIDQAGTAEQQIVLLAKNYLLFACNNFNRWRMIFEHQLKDDEKVPDWYQQKVNQIFKMVEIQFEQLSPSHTDEQSKQAARALWSGVHGICTLSLTGKLDLLGVDSIENTVVLLVENFMTGWKQS